MERSGVSSNDEPPLTDGEEEEVEGEEEESSEEEEESSDEEEEDDGTIPAVMKQHDRRRMALSPEHRELALRFKEAAQNFDELNAVPDLWYAQVAIVCGDDIQAGIDRLVHLQQYREEYDIVDDLAFGRKCMRKYLDTFPGYLMSCEFSVREGCYVLALDMTKFEAKALKATPMAFIQGSYFLEQIGCFELESMRKGVIVLLECEGYSWTEHMGIKVLDRIWTELWAVYPMNIYVLKHFHTGFFMNLLASISKRFIPREMRSKIQFGCKSDTRLDAVFNKPTEEEAQERLWSQLEDLLEKRYENERTFTL